MASPPISDAQKAAILAVRLVASGNNSEAANLLAPYLGLQPVSVRQQLYNFDEDKAIEELISLCKEHKPDLIHHDIRFWREEAHKQKKRIGELERTVLELGGIRNIPIKIPEWAVKSERNRGIGALIAHTSDLHYGEVIYPGEIQNVNEFNPKICEQRMQRYFNAVVEMGERWSSDLRCVGVILTLAGDLISGDIHEELIRTNACTSHEQVRGVVAIYTAAINLLLEVYPHIHVVAVPGNHARTTKKSTAKLYGKLSYDILIASMIHDRLNHDERITWQIDGATDQIVPLFGREIFISHGDKFGTGGGKGFAGPDLPIVRGGRNVREQQASFGERPDLILSAHRHYSSQPKGILANGSVPGYSEYGRDLRVSFEPPKQWLGLYTAKWGLRERCDVQLEEPREWVKPKVTIPAIMSKP